MRFFYYNTLAFATMAFFSLVSFYACGPNFTYNIDAKLNPYEISPLAAELNVACSVPCKAKVKVLGQSPVEQAYDEMADSLTVPVLGLYPGTKNEVLVTLTYDGGQVEETVQIETAPLPADFPEITINKLDRSKMEPGLHACDFHFANHGNFRSVPMLFDDEGIVRWYMDFGFNGKMVGPFKRQRKGQLLAVGRHVIYEMEMTGRPVRKTNFDQNYGMHHDNLELPNGDLFILVGKRNTFIEMDGEKIPSDSDFLILYDRKTASIAKEWDLAKHLDVSRHDINHLTKGDWLHSNGIAFDEKDSTIILSCKNQGVVKITWDDQLKWILAPHKNWGNAGRDGNGPATAPYLLTALDANGQPYPNYVQLGEVSAEDFDFPWGQHAPYIMENGNLLLFDNGSMRHFKNEPTYSRAVEYKIDEERRTVQQVWQYGKERGAEFFSMIVSDADFLPQTKNILVTSGHIRPEGAYGGKIVEVVPATGEEVFEATLIFKSANGDKTFAWGQMDILYRSERMELRF